MHALNDVAAIVENPSNVLRVDGTREVWVAVVATVRYRYFLQTRHNRTMHSCNQCSINYILGLIVATSETCPL